jgi:hypothetical protein
MKVVAARVVTADVVDATVMAQWVMHLQVSQQHHQLKAHQPTSKTLSPKRQHSFPLQVAEVQVTLGLSHTVFLSDVVMNR